MPIIKDSYFLAYYLIFQSYHPEDLEENPNPMPTAVESILKVFIMSLGTFGDIWNALDDTEHAFRGKVTAWQHIDSLFKIGKY